MLGKSLGITGAAFLVTRLPGIVLHPSIITAQVVMVAIMTMTPVHLHHHGGSITLVGITISLHIASMYALAPLVGTITDRFGAGGSRTFATTRPRSSRGPRRPQRR